MPVGDPMVLHAEITITLLSSASEYSILIDPFIQSLQGIKSIALINISHPLEMIVVSYPSDKHDHTALTA